MVVLVTRHCRWWRRCDGRACDEELAVAAARRGARDELAMKCLASAHQNSRLLLSRTGRTATRGCSRASALRRCGVRVSAVTECDARCTGEGGTATLVSVGGGADERNCSVCVHERGLT
jgi:hypothetical protein